MEAVVDIAKLDAKRTVRWSNELKTTVLACSRSLACSILPPLKLKLKLPWPSSQVFFDDSARNIAAGKAAGFHTVIVSFIFSVSHCVRARVFCDPALRIDADSRHGMAWQRVQVGSSALVPGADVALESIHNIKEALPELWAAAGDHVEAVLRSAAVETTVIA